jgi:Na+-transporting NADH:ubiquinone oxidoreductase subunit E
MEYLNTFVKAIFIENMIFAYFLGMCSYLAVSKTVKTAVGLGLAVIFVLGFTVPINYLLENYLMKAGALSWLGENYASIDLSFLSFIMFIAVVASFVQLVEMAVEKFAPALYASLGIFLPLIAVNCSILGGALFMQERQFRQCGHGHRVRLRIGGGLVPRHHCLGGHPRETALFQCASCAPRTGHHLHHHRSHGHGIHEFHGHHALITTYSKRI